MNTDFSEIKNYCEQHQVTLVAISKTKTPDQILKVFEQGQKIFGENKVQELLSKYEVLDKTIEWHMVGHLQTNKIKSVISFVSLIHSVDSMKLLIEINEHAGKISRIINVLLQIHIAQEESKFGFSFNVAKEILHDPHLNSLKHIKIKGLMGMASLTENKNQVRNEFRSLKNFFEQLKSEIPEAQPVNYKMETLSMGMSSDYKIAIEEGSTMVRIGSAIFGSR